MADLSSCYFCGAAMDVSLHEAPVVPDAFEPTTHDQATVLLCGACHRKFDRLLDPVVAAARAQAERARAARERASTESSSGTATAGRQTDREATPPANTQDTTAASDTSDAATGTNARSGSTARSDNSSRQPPSGRGGQRSTAQRGQDPSPSATEQRSTIGQAEDTDEPDVETPIISPTVGSDGANNHSEQDATNDDVPFEVDDTASVFDDDTDEPANTDSIFTDGTTTISTPDEPQDAPASDSNANTLGDSIDFVEQDTDPQARPDATDESRTNATDESRTNTTDGSRTNTTDGDDRTASSQPSAQTDDRHPDVDPKTYNKVVRLLKNRDLPIKRAEIETIAGSAYDINGKECEAIVDTAIERGLVDQRNDELVHPDGV